MERCLCRNNTTVQFNNVEQRSFLTRSYPHMTATCKNVGQAFRLSSVRRIKCTYIHGGRKKERARSCIPLYLSWLGAQSATLLSLPPSLSYLFFCPSLSDSPPFCFIGACLTPGRRSQIVPRSNVLHSHRKCPPSF